MSDKMRKYLPMNEPKLYCYTIYGFLFSVAKKKDMPWIYSNFIQLMYHDDWRMPIFEDHINMFPECPFVQNTILNFTGDVEKFIRTVINAIDNNYYCHLFLDWYYVNDSYHGDHFAHTSIISGYDRVNSCFTVYDNFDNGRFVKKAIPFDVAANAFFASRTASTGNADDNNPSNAFSYLSDITFIKYNECVYTKIDYNRIVYLLESYLDCENIIFALDDKSSVYGLDVYDRIDKELEIMPKGHQKDLHLIYEHKLLMLMRIEAILDANSDNELIEEYRHFSQEFLILRNLYIKFCIQNSVSKQIYRVQTKLRQLAVRDRELTQRILTALKQPKYLIAADFNE